MAAIEPVETITNLFTNPNFHGDGTRVTVAENLFTNPRLVGDGTWAEVRRNLFRTWVPANGATIETLNDADRHIRITPSTSSGQSGAGNSNPLAATSGDTYTFSAEVTHPSGGSLMLTGTGGFGSSIFTFTPGETKRISRTGTFTSTGSFGIWIVSLVAGTPAYEAKNPVLEKASSGNFFDGSTMNNTTPQPEDFRVRWLGIPNASESVMEIERVRGLTVVNAIAGVSTKAGKPAVRLIPTSSSNQSYILITSTAVESGGALIATVHLGAPLTGSLDVRRAGVDWYNPQTSGPRASNAAGSYPLRTAVGPFISSNSVRIWHGGTQGSGDVWWTDIGLFAGNYTGEAFSGSDVSDDPDLEISWSGAMDNSTSIKTGERVRGALSSANSVSIVSSAAGKPSVRIIPVTGIRDTWFVSTLPTTIRSGGTIVGTRYQEELAIPPLSATIGGIIVLNPEQNTGPKSAEPGEYPTRLRFSEPLANGYYIRLMNGSGFSETKWGSVGFFAGDYTGPAFSGDSEPFWYNGEIVYPFWEGEPNNSPSSFNWYNLQRYTINDIWNQIGQRFYETGVDRTVLYPKWQNGKPWNGVTQITEEPTGAEPTPVYLEGVRISNALQLEEFEATIQAYSSPREFSQFDGSNEIYQGLFISQQPRAPFDLTFRTLIGNDIDGPEHGYKIHLVYNGFAEPASSTYQTMAKSIEPNQKSWHITTVPEAIPGSKPTSHLVIDSTKAKRYQLVSLEQILYGDSVTEPRMPDIQEVIDIFST